MLYMFKNKTLPILCILILSIQNCGLFNSWENRDYEIIKSYYEDGSLEYKSSYLNNELDGPSSYYDIHGNLLSYAEYVDGSPHGIWKNFYSSGQIQYSCYYFHGHKHGEEKFYHKNGEIQSLVKYDYGEEISGIIRWDQNGELLY